MSFDTLFIQLDQALLTHKIGGQGEPSTQEKQRQAPADACHVQSNHEKDTSDDGRTVLAVMADYLGREAGLEEISQGTGLPTGDLSSLNNPRHVWAKEAVPSSHGSTKRVKLIVQADCHLYRTACRYPVYITAIYMLRQVGSVRA
jgi:hypothetical protein